LRRRIKTHIIRFKCISAEVPLTLVELSASDEHKLEHVYGQKAAETDTCKPSGDEGKITNIKMLFTGFSMHWTNVLEPHVCKSRYLTCGWDRLPDATLYRN
jgi:gamma-glutamylcysteine synthetase